jgi:hypothetical protein
MGERTRKLGKERVRDDQREIAGEPARDDLRGRSALGEDRGDEDVGVEDGAHSAAAGACLVLGLDRKLKRLPLAEIVSFPQALQQVKTEFAAQGLFDHLAIALPGPRCAYLDRTQNLLVDRKGSAHLRHICIRASGCADEQFSLRCATSRKFGRKVVTKVYTLDYDTYYTLHYVRADHGPDV